MAMNPTSPTYPDDMSEQDKTIALSVIFGVLFGIPLLCVAVHFCSVGGRIIITKINGMCTPTPTPTTDLSTDIESGTIPEEANPSRNNVGQNN